MYATMFDMKYNSSFPNFVLFFFVILLFFFINFVIIICCLCCDEFKFAPLHGGYLSL